MIVRPENAIPYVLNTKGIGHVINAESGRYRTGFSSGVKLQTVKHRPAVKVFYCVENSVTKKIYRRYVDEISLNSVAESINEAVKNRQPNSVSFSSLTGVHNQWFVIRSGSGVFTNLQGQVEEIAPSKLMFYIMGKLDVNPFDFTQQTYDKESGIGALSFTEINFYANKRQTFPGLSRLEDGTVLIQHRPQENERG